ncbi:MAG: DUF6263 family protein [Planctomycetota bacterium]|jgi:hypothetical protein
MKLRSLLLCGLSILFFSLPALAEDEEADLSWGFEKGKKYKFKISMRSEMKIKIPRADESKNVVHLERIADLETGTVKKGKSAQATFKGKYSRVTFLIEVLNQGSMSFDSDSDLDRREAARDPFLRSLLNLAGKVPFGFKMKDKGGVSKMKGHSRYVLKAFSPRNAKEPLDRAANLVLTQLLNDKAVEEEFNDIMILFPKYASLPGDTWEGKSKGLLYPMGGFLFETTYTLEKVKEGKIAVITCTSEVSKDPKVEPDFGVPSKDMPGVGQWIDVNDLLKKFKIEESERKGEFEFDLEKKQLVKAKLELKLQMKGSFQNPLNGENIDIPVAATHTRELKRVEEEGGEK